MTLNEHRRKVLRKLNFKQNKGTKHERWILKDVKTGKPYVVTYVSRSNQDIGDGLLKAICDQLYISKKSISPDRCMHNVERGVLQTFSRYGYCVIFLLIR